MNSYTRRSIRRKPKNRIRQLLVTIISLTFVGTFMVPSSGAPSCTLRPARSAVVSNNVFLGGDYIEIGLSPKGSWGTSVDKPAGFRGRATGTGVGLISDVDGFCATASDNVDKPIDYFMPGTPEERWGVGFKISGVSYYGSFSQLNNDDSSAGVTATHTVSNESSGDNLAAKVISTISLDGAQVLTVTATHSFEKSQAYFKTQVVITNLYGSTLTDVRYHRSFDPDNAKDQEGQYTTRQTIVSRFSSSGENAVEAKLKDSDVTALSAAGKILKLLLDGSPSISTNLPIVFYSKDSDSAVYFGGFDNANPFLPYSSTDPFISPQALNSTVEADAAMGIILRTTSLSSGSNSRTLTYITSLDRRSFSELSSELEAELEAEAGEDATPSNTTPVSPKLPRFDQTGRVLGISGGVVELTGNRLHCTTEIKVNGTPASFSHTVLPAADGRSKFSISLPKLEPGYHTLEMDTCEGQATYERFLYVSKPPVMKEGRIHNASERALLLKEIERWVREHRADFDSVECIVNTKILSQENARALAKDMCNKTMALLASPKSHTITVREKSTHVAIWYRVILSNQ